MYYFIYNFQAFLLVLVRIHSMFISAPFFSSDLAPFRLKTLLAFFVTLIIFPIYIQNPVSIPGNMGQYGLMVLSEVVIGLLIGFLTSVIFSAFQLAGQYFAVQIGFGFSEVLDPLAQVSVPIIGQLKNLAGMLVFLYIDGHHFLIRAIVRSFELAPSFSMGEESLFWHLKYVNYSFSGMFLIALKIAIPIVATVFLMSVSMGILAKAAPQMNIMMLGFPIKIVVAFVMIAIFAPVTIRIMRVSLERTFDFVSRILVHWPV